MKGQGTMIYVIVSSESKLIALGGGFSKGDLDSSSLRFSHMPELGRSHSFAVVTPPIRATMLVSREATRPIRAMLLGGNKKCDHQQCQSHHDGERDCHWNFPFLGALLAKASYLCQSIQNPTQKKTQQRKKGRSVYLKGKRVIGKKRIKRRND